MSQQKKFLQSITIINEDDQRKSLLELNFDGVLKWYEINNQIQQSKSLCTLGLVSTLQNILRCIRDFIPNAFTFKRILIFDKNDTVLLKLTNIVPFATKILLINIEKLLLQKNKTCTIL